MYRQRALALLAQLRGRRVAEWQIQDLIHHGKSAAVFRAHDGHRTAALKIFDPELVSRYGELTQLTRIHRELELRGLHYPHLVEIYDGGKCPTTNHHFVVMQHVNGQPLSKLLDTLPRTRIPTLIQQLACAAKFLEDQGLAHRDIKPDNILIDSNSGSATLLDLGVLRPINVQSTATDDDEIRHFVGTLQYSPPEFLLREEEDTLEGWRAVTFYQLGAVLHDLLERRPLFADSINPYARLVNAVQHTAPTFISTDVPELVHLARACLVKPPGLRLQLVTWHDFRRQTDERFPGLLARRRIAQARERQDLTLSNNLDWQVRWGSDQRHRQLVQNVELWLRQWCVAQELLPPVEIIASVVRGSPPSAVALHFRPDAASQLDHHLLLHFEIRVLDITSIAVELFIDALLSTSPAFPPDRERLLLYRGVATEEALRPVFENVIYATFDLATLQSVQPGRLNVAHFLMLDEEP